MLGLVIAGLVSVAMSPALAQKGGKPKPPAEQRATATFRCAFVQEGTDLCGAEHFVEADKITGDGQPYVGSGDTISGTGAFLRSDGELELQIRKGDADNRFIFLNFRHQTTGPAGPHRKTFDIWVAEGITVNTNTIDRRTGLVATDGLRGIPVGHTWPTRIKGNFGGPGDVLYTIRFNPDNYPGSTYVDASRVSENSWIIEATEFHVAQLVSPDTKGGKREPTDEGFYLMPFKLTLTVP
jgi:hypothetical protein